MRITWFSWSATLLLIPLLCLLAAGPAAANDVRHAARTDTGTYTLWHGSATEPGVIPAKGDTQMPPADHEAGLVATRTSVGLGAVAALLLASGVLFTVVRRRRRVLAT